MFYDKDESYLGELSKNLLKDRDFREFKDNFKGFELEDIVQMYVVKLANDINENSLKVEPSKEDKVNRLEKIGSFLKKTKRLDEMRKLQNGQVIEKTSKCLGNENENPLIVTKKEIQREFEGFVNKNKPEEIVDMKLAFWENRVTKTLESVKKSAISKHNVLYKKEREETNESLRNIEDNLAIDNPSFVAKYHEFLSNKITKEQFEGSEEFKKVNNLIENNYKETGNKFSPYEIFNIASMQENVAISYIEKDTAVQNLLVENRSLDVTCLEDKRFKEDGAFKVVKLKPKENKFSSAVEVHTRAETIDKIKEKKDITVEKAEGHRERKIHIKNILLTEFTDEKINKLKNHIDHINDYDTETKRVLKQYAGVLNYEVPELIQQKSNKKEDNDFIKGLQSKTNKNHRNNNNKNYSGMVRFMLLLAKECF